MLDKTEFEQHTLFQFFRRYHCMKNLMNVYAANNGHMFEAHGEEYQFVRRMFNAMRNPNATGGIWTLTDCEGVLRVVKGFHVVNRLGYFIAEKRAKPIVRKRGK